MGVLVRSLISMDTIQCEITNLCRNSCSNCTRFCGHREPFFMTLDEYKQAVDSMIKYQRMTGMQGGEPLLHPDFEKMCEYLRSKIPWRQCGLWTTLPEGYEHYREIICATFKHIFINDHTRPDIFHHPPLVGIEEVIEDKREMWAIIDQCWVQMSWSASIFPSGAWFCEIAGSMSMLFKEEERRGWPVEPGWWWRIPADFREQMEYFCPRCGFPIKVRRRASWEGIDDISPLNYERLRDKSRKIEIGKYKLYDFADKDMTMAEAPLAKYKNTDYRNGIAKRYGMFIKVNDERFWTPYLIKDWKPGEGAECVDNRPLMDIYREYWPQ